MEKHTHIAKDIAKIMRREHLEDENELREWLKKNNYASELMNNLTNEDFLVEKINSIDENEGQKQSALLKQKIDKRIHHRKVMKIASYIGAAAVVFLSFLLFYTPNDGIVAPNYSIVAETTNDNEVVIPTIILNSGEKINPTEQDIIETKNYVRGDSTVRFEKESFNKFIVPNKYTSKIKLNDGTIIHLNANSELSYPTEFNSSERSVILKGEAFFEVASSNVPFVVKAGNASIKVYGTKFNLKNYHSTKIYTMLMEGKIGLTYKDKKELILKPNELAIVDCSNDHTIVKEVNTAIYTSWLTGQITYERNLLSELIEDLSNWYGVEFNYLTDKSKNISISGVFDRTLSIEEILQTITLTTNIQFIKTERGYNIE